MGVRVAGIGAPVASMYMNPTLPSGGGLLPIHASAQAIALASPHMRSEPGEVGLSGMQMKPLVPRRS